MSRDEETEPQGEELPPYRPKARGVVALVGRPNVGKSTLFNRLARRRAAIVEDVPGVTRDRNYAEAEWGEFSFTLIDTGGFVPGEKDSLLQAVRQQAQLAVEEADVVLFVTDAKTGLTGADEVVANFLRKSGKPILLAVNKVDAPSNESLTADFHRLGFKDVFSISAEHGLGVIPLVEHLLDALPERELAPEHTSQAIRLAIVGRPNVGKSTLINAILRKNRLVASELPGTTRDPIDSEIEWKGRRFVLTDTAGIRRKKTIAQRVEEYSVFAALKTVERSDVAAVVLDATEPAVDQDLKIAALAQEKGRALLLVLNKWDTVEPESKQEKKWREALKHELRFVDYAPVVFTSAAKGTKVDKVLEVAAQLYDQFTFRAPTPQLNRLLEHVTTEHPAPFSGGKPLRLYYIAQVASAPPTFIINCNRPAGVPERYQRYIVNQLRSTFDLRVPIRLIFRERPGQAKRAARKRPDLMKKRPRRRDD